MAMEYLCYENKSCDGSAGQWRVINKLYGGSADQWTINKI